MTRKDYHLLSPRQVDVLNVLAKRENGLGTNPLASETGLTFRQAEITATSLEKRGMVMLFTYTTGAGRGAKVWRLTPEAEW